MIIYAFLIVLAFLLWLLFVYAVYKMIWYTIKMLSLKSFIKDMQKSGAVVEPQRKFLNMIFGKKGEADYIISADGKKYEISVLSFVSTHGRWNIEKTRSHYYIESRRQNKIFYSRYINSNTADHVAEYRGESRFSRKELFLTPIDPTFEKQILLVYPWPERITYTDARYNEVGSGEKIEGHVVMHIEDLYRLVIGKDE